MERTGGIGAHELEQDLLALADVLQPELRPFRLDLEERLFPAVLLKGEIDEPGAGDLGLFDDPRLVLDVAQDDLGDLPGRLGFRLGKGQGKCRGQIAVALLPRGFQDDGRLVLELELALFLGAGEGLEEDICYGLFQWRTSVRFRLSGPQLRGGSGGVFLAMKQESIANW